VGLLTRTIFASSVAGVIGDRRENRRYPMQLGLRFRTSKGRHVSEMAVGVTRDFSSKSIAVVCNSPRWVSA